MDGRGEVRSGARAIERAMAVLDCFANHTELSLSDVAAHTGLPVSTAHRIMRALVKGGFLERNGGDIYRVGPHVASLVSRRSVADDIAPHLYALAAGIKITAAFGVVDGNELVTLLCARPPVNHCAAQIPSEREPLHASAMGKALLAFDIEGPSESVRRLGRLPVYTAQTHQTHDSLVADLTEIRRRGFAICEQERREGVRAAAVPVLGPNREPLGAIGVQARSQRMTDDLLRSLLPALRHFSGTVGRLLYDLAVSVPGSP